MAGKISEYIETAINKATDLLDKTVLEGGVFVTRSVTALNLFKPRTKTVALTQPTVTVAFGFETSASVNITADSNIVLTDLDAGGCYQLMLHADATPRTVVLGSSFGQPLNNETTTFTTYPNTAYLIEIFVSATGAVTHRRDNFIFYNAGTITGTDEAVFKTHFGYFTRSLTAIGAWIKSAIYASDVINNSTKIAGTTVKDVFDNAEEAVLATTVQDSDMFAGMRWENLGAGLETYNKYWTAEDMKAYFATSGALITFVATAGELTAALASEKETMQICATAGITSGSISNVYAGNLWITGRKLIFNSGLITPNSSSGRAVTRVFFDASVTMIGSAGDGFTRILVTAGIWHFTFRNLSQDMPIKFVAAGTSEIHVVCGNTITVDPASTGTYTVTQDSTLDLGQDDVRLDGSNVFNVGAGISANTEVLIKANTGFVTLATLGALGGIITGSDRKAIVTTVTRNETATTFYDIATIPDGWELESVDIIRKDGMHRTAYVSIQCEYGAGNFVIVSGATSIPDAEGYALRIWHSPDKIQHDRYLAKEFTFLYVNNYGANMLVRAIPNSTWLESELEFHIIIKRTL